MNRKRQSNTSVVVRTIFFISLSLVFGGIASQGVSDVRICPPEPTFNGTCDFPCSRCEGSTCIIENPTTSPGFTLVCPEGRSCKVVCFPTAGITSICQGLIVQCPQNASCDVVCLGGACKSAYVSCPVGGKHSCSATCDNLSSIGTFKCDNSTSCNCNSACETRSQCQPGVDCMGDPCFGYSSPCHSLFPQYSGVVRSYNSSTGTCSCSCKNTSEIYDNLGSALYPVCWSNDSYCRYRGCNGNGICSFVPQCRCDSRLFRGALCDRTCSCNAAYLFNDTNSHVAACDFDSDTCLCMTGWTGTYCNVTEPLICSIPSPIMSPTEFAPTETAPVSELVPVSAPECPMGCSRCEDGWCIVLSASFVTFGTGTCPEGNFPCRVICDDSNQGGCWATNECWGDRPCEFVCGGAACYGVNFHCGSSISCKAMCSSSPQSTYDVSSIRIYRHPSATYSASGNVSCPATEISSCTQRAPCIKNVSCSLDDPCSATKCFGGQTAILNSQGSSCECRFPNGTVKIQYGFNMPILQDNSCGGTCLNGGICNQKNCTCRPGFQGRFCETYANESNAIISIYQSKETSYCPRACSYCDRGVCIVPLTLGNSPLYCPDGWPCIFICQDEFCAGRAVCEGNSGPCMLYCSGDRIPSTFVYFLSGGGSRGRDTAVRLTSAGNCISTTLVCNTTATGLPCGVVCANDPQDDTNQIKSIRCANSSSDRAPIRTSSTFGLDPIQSGESNCWMSETCYITELDPCFINEDLSYKVVCPITANAFQMEAKKMTNATGQVVCSCVCPAGFKEKKFLIDGGILEDRYCVPVVDCAPECANGGLCVYESMNSSRVRCQCFSGYTGATCESRCFFPVEANVTSCDNGRYIIDGDVRVNRTVDLIKETSGLVQLNISGSLILLNSTTLVIFPSNQSSIAPSIFIKGDFIQANNAGLENEIYVVYRDGVPVIVSSQFFVDGNAILDGRLYLALNSSEIAAAIRRQQSGASVTLLTGNSVTISSLKDGDVIDIDDSGSQCDSQRVVARARLNEKSISALFSLEPNPNANSSACNRGDPLNGSSASIQVTAIVLGVLIPVAAIGIGVGVFFYQRAKMAKIRRDIEMKLAGGAGYQPPSSSSSPASNASKPTQPATNSSNNPSHTGSSHQKGKWMKANTAQVELFNMEYDGTS